MRGAPPPPPAPTLSEADLRALTRELDRLRKQARSEAGAADVAHLRKMVGWGSACTGLGLGTAWIAPNPVSAILLSLGTFSRWTMVAHHVLHRGYDSVPGAPTRYHSAHFARGWRRYVDWFDWMLPEGWHEEHDLLHHYRLGEAQDPDQVERNLAWLRASGLPLPARGALVVLVAAAWKWLYYAQNTLGRLQEARAKRAGQPIEPSGGLLDPGTWDPRGARGRELWLRCLLPYAAWNFAVLPALYAPLGPWAVFSVWANQVMAEVLTNLHAFAVIVPNHTGKDLYRFDTPAGSRQHFYLRQILGSANYACGDDVTDFLHGYLNYQIEHHLFPDLTMLQYRRIQPQVKALCARYGLSYVQESVARRVLRTVEIMTGLADMRRHEGRAAARDQRPEARAAVT